MYRFLQLSTCYQTYVLVTGLTKALCLVFADYSEIISAVVILGTAIGFGALFYVSKNHEFNYFMFVSIMLGALTGAYL